MVKHFLLFLLVLAAAGYASAQKVDSIYFHLYTDSLKKGFYNYINVDGQCADGRWLPLDSAQVRLSANTGFFTGNDLFIDSTYRADSVRVKAVLRSNPGVWKEITIYIRKRPFTEPLPTDDDMFREKKRR